MVKKKYRLQVLLVIKERFKRQCEMALARALKALYQAEETLRVLETEKKKIKEHIGEEKRKLHEKVASGSAKMKDPQVRSNFLRKLYEDLELQEKRIAEQKEILRQAQIKVQRCRQDYILAAQDLNVMEKHKELWEKKEQHRLTAEDDKLMNELGQVIHQMAKTG